MLPLAPATVQGVLAARIDRLPVAQKDLLQTLAIIGKEFPLSLIEHVTAQAEEELRPLLGDLQAGDFIYERPAFPEVEYAFKHALTQEVAANSLLTSQRCALHERTARAIETLFPGRLKDYCSELASPLQQEWQCAEGHRIPAPGGPAGLAAFSPARSYPTSQRSPRTAQVHA